MSDCGRRPSERIGLWPTEQLRRVAQCLLVLVEHFAYHTSQHVARWRKSTRQREAVRPGQQDIGRSPRTPSIVTMDRSKPTWTLLKLAAL
jgi:hypothetical protein